MNPAGQDAFPIAPLRLTLRSAGMAFAGFSGSLWHGGLGMMLERRFLPVFDLLYGGDTETRLYALLPPSESNLPEGSSFDLRLTLFGPATRHILACTQAIAELGDAGVGSAGGFRLETAAVMSPDGDRPYFTAAEGLLVPPADHDLRDYLAAPPAARRVRLRLTTPLRLKEGNDLLRTAPRYEQVIHRLFGRLDQIAHALGVTPPLVKAGRSPLLEEGRAVRLVRDQLRWMGLDRRSGRTGERMRFGGLVGEIEYEGGFARTLPWLAAGRLLQIGGKSAFGFGGFDAEMLA